MDKVNSRKEDCSRFVYCPATFVLLQGDTIRGRFTFVSGIFYQVHENNDSNINRTGKENGEKNSYYPVSGWYKRFTAEEIASYTVSGQTYESIIHVADKNGNDMPWNNKNVFFLQRLSPDSSLIKLYYSYTPHSRGDKTINNWGDFIGTVISDMLIQGEDTYYIHFPGETPRKVWIANQSDIGLAAKAKIAALFSACPVLDSIAFKIKASSAKQDLIQAMLSKADLKYPKTLPAILAILKKYDDCCYSNKK